MRRPDVRYGDHAIRCVPQLVADRSARRVLLVCGRRSFEASGAARIWPELERAATVVRWSEFAPNPEATDLARGLELLEQAQPDLVLGIGGGSALDLAKLLAGFAGITDPAKLAAAIRSGDPIASRPVGLILAPTTSGSGSEATHFAVVYLGQEKFSVAGDGLRPDLVVLDPALSRSGSRYQRATSGIDAVAQAIESLWAVGATEQSRRWARHALGLLLPAIEPYVNQPTGQAARAMAIGSHLAGRAIDFSKTTAAHALSYAFTKRYGVSHGHAVGLTLGAFIEAHGTADPARLHPALTAARLAEAMRVVVGALRAESAPDAGRRFAALMRRIGLPASLPAAAEDVDKLVAAVNLTRLGNNPVTFSGPQLVNLVARAVR